MEELDTPLSGLSPLEPRIGLASHPDRAEASGPGPALPVSPLARPSASPLRPGSALGSGGFNAAASQSNPPLARPAAHAPKNKPDPRPMRAVLAAGGLAALSAIATAVVLPPSQPSAAAPGAVGQGGGSVTQSIQYIHLQPGQTPPPGAKVIDAAAPQPTTVVTVVNAPAQKAIIIKTTQSGTVVP